MLRNMLFASLFLVAACDGNQAGSPFAAVTGDAEKSDRFGFTDKRRPELGSDPRIVLDSKISMSDALAKVEADKGGIIEAKFELDDNQKLSLSVYPVGKGLDVDAERNVFQEAAGDPTVRTFKTGLEVFSDQEHLTRSSR